MSKYIGLLYPRIELVSKNKSKKLGIPLVIGKEFNGIKFISGGLECLLKNKFLDDAVEKNKYQELDKEVVDNIVNMAIIYHEQRATNVDFQE